MNIDAPDLRQFLHSTDDGFAGVEAGENRELVGDQPIRAAARQATAGLDRMFSGPLLEDAGHDEAYEGRFDPAGFPQLAIEGIKAGEDGVELVGEQRTGGRFDGAGAELDPPFVATARVGAGA